MKQRFLARLREDLADHSVWLVYADWLEEQGDQTSSFTRLSLELTSGNIPAEQGEARVREFERLHALADPETRELLAEYRSNLPTRFRVLNTIFIGEDPPREMFGYARTVAVGFLEAGRIKPGMNLGVGAYADGRPRVVQTILLFDRTLTELAAGREPIEAGVGWLGHLKIQAGSVLTEVPVGGP